MMLQKKLRALPLLICCLATEGFAQTGEAVTSNPLMVATNVPVEYAKIAPNHLEEYASRTLADVMSIVSSIKQQHTPTFANVFEAMDDISNRINTASNNCFMLYWVSPDSLTRVKGLEGYQLLDSLSTSLYSDKGVYDKMLAFKSSAAYSQLKGSRKLLVDDMVLGFERTGVNLAAEKLERFKTLTKEISQLSTDYSSNMNSASDVLTLDENGTEGLPEAFKNNYKISEGKYEIPIINATNLPVMSNATKEETRKAFYYKFYNRAANKNLTILDSLVSKRNQLALLMGYRSFAAYNLVPRMAKDPATVWKFINDLVSLSGEKAKADIKILTDQKKAANKNAGTVQLEPWDTDYYKEQLLKNQYNVNNEELKAYFPMDECLKGMFVIYQKLLGLEFRKVANPSVWHEEVDMYEVYEAGKLKGRFYMDLYPRPNKETWFYGVNIVSGKTFGKEYEIPVAMLLGNFTRPSKTQPSLLSRRELNTLFHEFGHIANMMSYEGEFSSQSNSKADFAEAMSQLFENWLWNYDILSSFAKHYKTGEKLPKAMFDNMLKAKNVSSGLASIRMLQRCIYDMNLYDKYNSTKPLSTDTLWKDIDRQLNVMKFYAPNTHQQASWIHINTHPVYMYGYLWSDVYAQDMFTEFEKNGLTDAKTGMRYRKLILANGTQRDIVKAVEEFLGRSSDNKAYIKSLGL